MPSYTKVYLTGKVYGLIDPRNQEIRYVGATAKSLNSRLSGHKRVTAWDQSDRNLWVKELQSAGYQPIIFELEEVSFVELENTEKFWISYFKMLGCDLTNQTGFRRKAPRYSIRFPKPEFQVCKKAS